LAVSLGGYAAEKLVFNDLTTGAADDLHHATGVARSLVTKYGMSDKIGPVVFDGRSGEIFLGKDFYTERNYSEEVAKEIDSEVRELMNNALKEATKVLQKHRKILNAIAEKLIEKETIERDEFDAILKSFKIKPKKSIGHP